jgi:hypothetical protein
LPGFDVDLKDAIIVGLGEVFEHDSTIEDLVEKLPDGFEATRAAINSDWVISKYDSFSV